MKQFIILFIMVGLIQGLQAQTNIAEVTANMSRGSNNGFTMIIDGMEPDDVEDLWSDYLDNYKGKERKIRKSDEMLYDDAEIDGVSRNTVDIYSMVTEKDRGSQLTVWFDLGGAYLSSKRHPDRYPAASRLLQGFLIEVEREKADIALKAQEDRFKSMEKELEDFQKEQSKLEDEIEKCQEQIKEAEAGIEAAQRAQEQKQAEMKEQRRLIESTQDRLKSLKKESN